MLCTRREGARSAASARGGGGGGSAQTGESGYGARICMSCKSDVLRSQPRRRPLFLRPRRRPASQRLLSSVLCLGIRFCISQPAARGERWVTAMAAISRTRICKHKNNLRRKRRNRKPPQGRLTEEEASSRMELAPTNIGLALVLSVVPLGAVPASHQRFAITSSFRMHRLQVNTVMSDTSFDIETKICFCFCARGLIWLSNPDPGRLLWLHTSLAQVLFISRFEDRVLSSLRIYCRGS